MMDALERLYQQSTNKHQSKKISLEEQLDSANSAELSTIDDQFLMNMSDSSKAELEKRIVAEQVHLEKDIIKEEELEKQEMQKEIKEENKKEKKINQEIADSRKEKSMTKENKKEKKLKKKGSSNDYSFFLDTLVLEFIDTAEENEYNIRDFSVYQMSAIFDYIRELVENKGEK